MLELKMLVVHLVLVLSTTGSEHKYLICITLTCSSCRINFWARYTLTNRFWKTLVFLSFEAKLHFSQILACLSTSRHLSIQKSFSICRNPKSFRNKLLKCSVFLKYHVAKPRSKSQKLRSRQIFGCIRGPTCFVAFD